MTNDIALRLAVALAIGFLVGVERGWQDRDAPAGSRTAGIRTYGLMGLLGGVFATLAHGLASPMLFATAFLVASAIFAAFKFIEERRDNEFSVTGVIAAMLVFGLGGYAVVGDLVVAAGAGVASAGLLASRETLHNWLKRLTWPELRSALLLLAMSVVVLPALPDQAVDPFGGVNPRQIWLFTVLTASISFAGYVVTKIGGPRSSLIMTGLAGGVVSSTIVTISLARRSRHEEGEGGLAGGALLASMVSVLRVLTLSVIVQPALFGLLAPPTAAAAGVFGLWGAVLLTRSVPREDKETRLGNPFDPGAVLLLGVFMAVVAFIFGWLAASFSPSTIYGVAALTSLADVDALAMSTARLTGQSLALDVAATAILIALAVNGIERLTYAAIIGRKRFAAHVLGASFTAALAGYLVYRFFIAP